MDVTAGTPDPKKINDQKDLPAGVRRAFSYDGPNNGGEEFLIAHQRSDKDIDKDALHHTLGNGPYQAAPGRSTHKRLTDIETFVELIFGKIYPIGTIYFSIVNTNPGTLFGGTWVAWGKGRVPVGVDTAQIEFDTVEETGGAKTHTLVAGEIPQHTHAIDHNHAVVNTSTDPVPGSVSITDAATNPASTFVIDRGSSGDAINGNLISGSSHNHTVDLPNFTGNSDGGTGGGGAHNNLQPYITCYMWKRTA